MSSDANFESSPIQVEEGKKSDVPLINQDTLLKILYLGFQDGSPENPGADYKNFVEKLQEYLCSIPPSLIKGEVQTQPPGILTVNGIREDLQGCLYKFPFEDEPNEGTMLDHQIKNILGSYAVLTPSAPNCSLDIRNALKDVSFNVINFRLQISDEFSVPAIVIRTSVTQFIKEGFTRFPKRVSRTFVMLPVLKDTIGLSEEDTKTYITNLERGIKEIPKENKEFFLEHGYLWVWRVVMSRRIRNLLDEQSKKRSPEAGRGQSSIHFKN